MTLHHQRAAPRSGAPTATLDEAWRLLEKKGWLADRTPEVTARLRAIARLRRIKKGEPIYLCGDTATGVFGLVDGSFRFHLQRKDGDDFIAYRAGRGWWFGELAAFSKRCQLLSVWATEDSLLVHLPVDLLRRLVESDPILYVDFFQMSQDAMLATLEVIANLSYQQTDRRVAQRLLDELEMRGDLENWIATSQIELSEMLVLSIPTLQRCLRRFANDGIIKLGYSRIRVIDRAKLLQVCGNGDAPPPRQAVRNPII